MYSALVRINYSILHPLSDKSKFDGICNPFLRQDSHTNNTWIQHLHNDSIRWKWMATRECYERLRVKIDDFYDLNEDDDVFMHPTSAIFYNIFPTISLTNRHFSFLGDSVICAQFITMVCMLNSSKIRKSSSKLLLTIDFKAHLEKIIGSTEWSCLAYEMKHVRRTRWCVLGVCCGDFGPSQSAI